MGAAEVGQSKKQRRYDKNRNQDDCHQNPAQAVVSTLWYGGNLNIGRNGFPAMGTVLPSGSDRISAIGALSLKRGATLRTGGVFLQNWRLTAGTLVTIKI